MDAREYLEKQNAPVINESGADETVQHQQPPPNNPEKTPPLTHIKYADEVRFIKPSPPTYSVAGSIFSILSLIFMSAMATVMFLQLVNPDHNMLSVLNGNVGNGVWSDISHWLRAPATNGGMATWVWIPFAFTIFGSTLGWVFELGLLLAGTPFQQQRTVFTRFISSVRLLNLAPVTTTIFFFICALVIPEPNLRMALLYLAGAATFGLGFALFLGTRSTLVPIILLGTQLAQIALVLTSSSVGGFTVASLLIGQSVLQFIALMIGTSTPGKSTVFHITNIFAGLLLFNAILTATAINPDFSNQVAPVIPAGSLLMWGLVVACVAGLLISARAFPDAYNNFRTLLSKTVWTPIYFKLVSAERFPDPVNLSKVFDKVKPVKTRLKPYYQAHPQHLMQNLGIPAVEISNIEASVTVFKKLFDEAKSAFKLIAGLDHTIPQSKITTPLKDKPRMAIWSDGSQYWPTLFHKNILGNTLPDNGELDKTPQVALDAFREGQLLAYLTESGVANTFAQPAEGRGEGALVSDFRFLEKYETKPEYEPYGGVAYFQINKQTKKLELVSVIAPFGQEEIAADPRNPTFRHAESLVLASMYYQVISGKHLAEIHMTYNLVEVSMHNAFDVQGQWGHPFRTFMYLHFFSHELAEEVTTEHLVQEGAVFSQVFATTHDALISHLNDSYSNFEYGFDEDFEGRAAAMTIPGSGNEILPNACIKWELQYFEIWLNYTTQLIDIIYADDQAVQNDQYLQDFHSGLLEVLLTGLPARYDGFQTKKGVARFAADTIHHAVVRHQVYGTTGIRAALDPRISTTQVPRDTGTPGVDEWRSLAFVALATGKARFTLLTDKTGKDFTYLLDGVEVHYRQPMAKVFDELQKDLLKLDQQWTADPIEKDFNYNYFRAIPSVMHTGPGY